jgi:hypothetical protein
MQGFAIEYGGIVGHGDNAAFEAIDRAITSILHHAVVVK